MSRAHFFTGIALIGLLITLIVKEAFFFVPPGENANVAAGSDIVQIALWDQEEAENTKVMDQWISKFHTEHPKIRISRQTYPPEDLRTKFTMAATGGQAAELVWGPNDVAGQFSTAGIIQSVERFISPEDFHPIALNAVKLGTKLYGIPMTYGNHLVLLYNKKLVPQIPNNTDDIIALSKKFVARGKYGLVMFQNEPFWLAPFLGGFGGWPLEVSDDGTTKITLDTPAMINTLQFIRDLKFKHKIFPKECDYDCAKMLFLDGKASMVINGDWSVKEFQQKMGKDLGIAPLPVVSETNLPASPLVGGRYLFVNARLGKKQEAVQTFVNYLTSLPVQIEVATKLGRIPSLNAALKENSLTEDPTLVALMKAAEFGKPMPPQVEMRAAWDAMRPIQQRVLTGEIPPERAAKEMQQSALDKQAALQR